MVDCNGHVSSHLKRSKVKYVCIPMMDTKFDICFYFLKNTISFYSNKKNIQIVNRSNYNFYVEVIGLQHWPTV